MALGKNIVLSLLLTNPNCNTDLVIEYETNWICTNGTQNKTTNKKTILAKEIPCCDCGIAENGNSNGSDSSKNSCCALI